MRKDVRVVLLVPALDVLIVRADPPESVVVDCDVARNVRGDVVCWHPRLVLPL